MFKNRIARTAAVATFGLAALGAVVAAPAYAAPDASGSSSSGDTSTTAPKTTAGTPPRLGDNPPYVTVEGNTPLYPHPHHDE